jgi:hypothetical protein
MEFEVFGKQRGFKLGTYTFKLINQATGTKTVEEVFARLNEKDESYTLSFYFCCAKHHELSNKKPVDFEEIDVADWLDELGAEKVKEITTELFKVYLKKKHDSPSDGYGTTIDEWESIAVIELGMDSDVFWSLSLWEWSLWIQRILNLQNQRKQDQELLIELQRNWEARYFNAKLKKNAEEFKPTDFYKLSWDPKEDDKTIKFESAEQMEAEMKKRVRRRHG